MFNGYMHVHSFNETCGKAIKCLRKDGVLHDAYAGIEPTLARDELMPEHDKEGVLCRYFVRELRPEDWQMIWQTWRGKEYWREPGWRELIEEFHKLIERIAPDIAKEIRQLPIFQG